MNRSQLVTTIHEKQSFLCIGLDTDIERLPEGLEKSPAGMLEFNKAIIDATLPTCVSYKLNLAFYEAFGHAGWRVFEQTVEYLRNKGVFIIADAKRGDIGNTSQRYARAFFEATACDAVTVNPYMGRDSVQPFLGFRNKWVIALGLTSNLGARDLELQTLENGIPVYEHMMHFLTGLGSSNELMLVIGATQKEQFPSIRAIAPDHFFLVPGVGAQGGTIADLAPLLTSDVGLLVNSSRGIIYASGKADFAEAAAREAGILRDQMRQLLEGF